MSELLQIRRGATADIPNPLAAGEPGFALDTCNLYMGTGVAGQNKRFAPISSISDDSVVVCTPTGLEPTLELLISGGTFQFGSNASPLAAFLGNQQATHNQNAAYAREIYQAAKASDDGVDIRYGHCRGTAAAPGDCIAGDLAFQQNSYIYKNGWKYCTGVYDAILDFSGDNPETHIGAVVSKAGATVYTLDLRPQGTTLICPPSTNAGGPKFASGLSFYVDESANTLTFWVKYANGSTTKTATVALV
jgi:hypothetical protein